MNSVCFSSFSGELQKLAFFRTLGGAIRDAWKYDIYRKPVVQAGKNVFPEAAFRGTRKITKHLPVGMKSLTALGAGLSIPEVLPKQDPAGEGRSRLERGLQAIGDIGGGLAGAGLAARGTLARGHPIIAALGGGIIGSVAGGHLLSSPVKAFRVARQNQQRQALENYYRQTYPYFVAARQNQQPSV